MSEFCWIPAFGAGEKANCCFRAAMLKRVAVCSKERLVFDIKLLNFKLFPTAHIFDDVFFLRRVEFLIQSERQIDRILSQSEQRHHLKSLHS